MKKASIMLIALMVISVGFLSGCVDIPDEITDEMIIVSFNVDPSMIDVGDSANLSWVVTGADTALTIDNGIGNVSLSGNRIITPTETTTYTLTATNMTSTKIVTTLVIVRQEDNEVNPIAVIDTSMGTIKVELFEDRVPNTVDNFVKLANDGFFDGLVFHRVIDDFMIQGGGFETDGSKKESPYGTIDLEINAEVRHVDGAIAMARTSDPNSATSQFYICDGVHEFLNDDYAAFGKTIEGMDVVRAIALVDTTTKFGMQNWPEDDVIINSIIII